MLFMIGAKKNCQWAGCHKWQKSAICSQFIVVISLHWPQNGSKLRSFCHLWQRACCFALYGQRARCHERQKSAIWSQFIVVIWLHRTQNGSKSHSFCRFWQQACCFCCLPLLFVSLGSQQLFSNFFRNAGSKSPSISLAMTISILSIILTISTNQSFRCSQN